MKKKCQRQCGSVAGQGTGQVGVPGVVARGGDAGAGGGRGGAPARQGGRRPSAPQDHPRGQLRAAPGRGHARHQAALLHQPHR